MKSALAAFATVRSLEQPHRLTAASAWKEHIPFALDLVGAIRPSLLVELGTHGGDSYCAFCQSVDELGLSTRCFAVDTWKGDEHAGLYGPEVLADLRAHHDPLYGRFSTLLESTFEAARASFGDGSIDLLHVDGYHTYEAVRADVEAWLPKLSASGVMLLHDTNVRERGFGVWRVWEEQRSRYPSFEFAHGHGLGVLAVGAAVPPGLARLLEATEAEQTEVQTYYALLGARLVLVFQAGLVGEELAQRRQAMVEMAGQLAAAQAAQADIAGRLATSQASATDLNARLAAARAAEADLAERLAASSQEIAATQARARESEVRASALAEERDAVRERLSAIEGALDSSRVWRLAQRWRALRDRLAPTRSVGRKRSAP